MRRVFSEVDVDGSGALSTDELHRLLLKFSISLSDREVSALQSSMDADGSGVIEFEEFVMWFPTILRMRDAARVVNAEKLRDAKAQMDGLMPDGEKRAGGRRIQLKAVVDWKHLRAMLPFSKTDEIEKTRRDQLFNNFDVNGNGFLSLAEVDKGMRDVLKLPELFNAKPVMMRAFQASKNVHKRTTASIAAARHGGWRPGHTLLGEDYVERSEFRILLEYLWRYFELFLMFEEIDGADGLDVDDRRVSLSEFTASRELLLSWGLPSPLASMDPSALFRSVDADGHGMILFSEFADWALKVSLGSSLDS